MVAIRAAWTAWRTRNPDAVWPAGLTAVPPKLIAIGCLPIRLIQVDGGVRSIDRAGLSRLAFELVRSGNEAVEPGHGAAVILLGDGGKLFGDAVGSRG